LHLSRELADRRVFPSFDILKSGTRREELLFTDDELKRIHLLRRALSGTKPGQAMEAILDLLRLTATNAECLKALGSGLSVLRLAQHTTNELDQVHHVEGLEQDRHPALLDQAMLR